MAITKSRLGLGLVRGLGEWMMGKRGEAIREPSRVARVAGRQGGRWGLDAGLEPLEQRTLLFTMTVGPGDVDPATGIGSVTAHFGYLVPFMWHEIPQPQADDVVLENFDDEQAPWTTFNPPRPPSGTFFSQSDIQISYTTPGALVQLENGFGGQNDQDLRVMLTQSGTVTFSFFDGVQEGNPTLRLTKNARFTIGNSFILPNDAGGLNTDVNAGTKVELLSGGQVVLTLSGATLAALGTPVLGPGNPLQFTFSLLSGFDSVRFSSVQPAPDNANYLDTFRIDNISIDFPAGRYGDVHDDRAWGAEVKLTGPVGTSIEILDVYGRQMRQTIRLGKPLGAQVAVVDPVDSGLPLYNDGLGRINFLAGDSRSSLMMWGGPIESSLTPPQTARFVEREFYFELPTDAIGIYDDFEGDAGLGFGLTNATPPVVMGLPAGNGTLVMGSPFVRPNTSAQEYYGQLLTYNQQQFSTWDGLGGGASFQDNDLMRRADQGFFVPTGMSLSNVQFNGIVFGNSQFGGAVGSLSVGLLLGNISVRGDVGSLMIGSDSGLWVREDVTNPPDIDPDPTFLSRNEITIGRTVGQIQIAGRNATTITVLGDVNNPTRPRFDFRNYLEREVILTGINPATQQQTIGNIMGLANTSTTAPTTAIGFGLGIFRNDQILGSEFIGNSSTSATVVGQLGRQDPINTRLDSADVYAFPATAGVRVSVDMFFQALGIGFSGNRGFDTLGSVRIVDINGRTVASADYPEDSVNRLAGATPSVRLGFTPDHSDVYYLVVNAPQDPASRFREGPMEYRAEVQGMAPVTVGGISVGARMGFAASPTVINVQSGSVGMLRVGAGIVARDNTLASPAGVVTTFDDTDDFLDLRESSITVAGSMSALVLGSDVFGFRGAGAAAAQISIGGSLGAFRTGVNPLAGTGPTEGDVLDMSLSVGGSVGEINIGGAVRFDQDRGSFVSANRPVSISTGVSGGRGDIGRIVIGQRLQGENFILRTSPGSIIDEFIMDESGGLGLIDGATPRFILGAGSDLRFASFTQIQSGVDPDATRLLVPGTPLTLTDDAGGTVVIRIDGGDQTSFGTVRMMRVDGSQGVAISRIDLTLSANAVLKISGTNLSGRVSIGRIVVNATGAGAQILIGGQGEIDVRRIDHTGVALAMIQNATTGGDIVAIDSAGVTQVQVNSGNLGRTQTGAPGSYQRLIGPFMGIASGYVNAVGGALGVLAGNVNNAWNNATYYPIDGYRSEYPDDVTLEDIGGPFDPYLNGLVVRAGNVTLVHATGSVGDVILQGGDITTLRANVNTIRDTAGAFEGIVGTIYARDIGTIDIGDGLAGRGDTSLAAAGIFADDDIQTVVGGRGLNPLLGGIVIAANNNPDVGGTATNGVVAVRVESGRIDGAYIGAATFDSFWSSARFVPTVLHADDAEARGAVNRVDAVLTNLFRTRIFGINVNAINVTGGAYDATLTEATSTIGRIVADEFRNTTLLREPLEFRPNGIHATRDIAQVTTNPQVGDISDLTIEAGGAITTGVTARNITRLELNVAGVVSDLYATGDLRATAVNAGRLNRAFAGGDIRSSRFDISGPIFEITAAQNITSTVINTTGPDSKILKVQASGFLTGTITSQGPIDTIISTGGDVIASITTTNPAASLNLLQAGGSLLVNLDIAGDVNTLMAGRNIGAQSDPHGSRAINVKGNLNLVQATGGQIYTDVKVGQKINLVRNARVVALPGNDLVSTATIRAYGRIERVEINGDLNGSIISESGGIGVILITDGSYRPGNQVTARDGGIDQFIIVGGHLMGNIFADETIQLVSVRPNAAGFWGDIGVNPNLSQTAPFDSMRNQLPPGVAPNPTFQGARIQSGTNIGLVEVQKAGVWESAIIAGQSIGRVFAYGVMMNDNVTPGLGGSFIVAGDNIGTIEFLQFVGGAIIGAGVKDLGADGRPGGTGADTDTVQFGRIGDLTFKGGTGAVTIFAGMNAAGDGVYNTADDEVADGVSKINSVTVTGQALVTTVFADNGIGFTSPGIIKGGPGLNQANPGRVIEFVPTSGQLTNGVATPFVTPAGETGTITFSGPGQAYYEIVFDSDLGRNVGRLAIINSTLASSLVVNVDNFNLTDFKVTSNDGSSLKSASIRGNMVGGSSFYFDGYVEFAEFGGLDTTGLFGAGNDFGRIVVGPVTRGSIFGNYINSIVIGGDLGVSSDRTLGAIDVLAVGSILIGGSVRGLITSERDIGSLQVLGAVDHGNVRAGRSLGAFTAAAVNDSRISARNSITSVVVNGSVTDSAFYAGADLGYDGEFGGTGLSADTVTDGSMGPVTVLGNFVRSDVAAGLYRGSDGFLGSSDDKADEGRSSITSVTISGQASGSLLNSQSYRIASNGTVGPVNAAGGSFSQSGNLKVDRVATTAVPLQVTDLRVELVAGLQQATIAFNQAVDASTLPGALRISEVRSGSQTIILAEGTDYTVSYNAATHEAIIIFSATVMARSLPQQPGLPGPGLYRFTLLSSTLRGDSQNQTIDGNGDGFAAVSDDYSQDAFVGDVGDKITPGTVVSNGTTIDFYGAGDLSVAMDNNRTPDGLPDANTTYTVRGTIGDHPDTDANNFRIGGDADLYRITLRAGQILRLGAMQGAAVISGRALLDASGAIIASTTGVFQTGTETALALRLENALPDTDGQSIDDQILIKQTGTYYILVASSVNQVNVADSSAVANLPVTGGATGSYNFTVTVFDDGDTGFTGDTDSGDGARVVNAPTPIAFAGDDGVLNTADDVSTFAVGSYVFTLDRGGDGIAGNANDFISGSNGAGISSSRRAGANGTWGDSDDVIVSYVGASIGNATNAGVPNVVESDVDVYHLNNRSVIAPGTLMRATIDLTELGSNLGLSQDPRTQDLRGDVQLAVFDTSSSTSLGDALLVAASTDFKAVGGRAASSITTGSTTYGYDANGNFFIQWVTTGRLDVAGNAPATYAVYVQGAIRSDYVLTIEQLGTTSVTRTHQNIFLETRGGIIDWLEAGRSTSLSAFTAAGLGITGTINGQPVDSYIVSQVASKVSAVFAAANVDVRLSTTSAGFTGQPFSTVFLTGSQEPTAFAANGTFGVAQRSDPFNAARADQAVVFAPSLGVLGTGPDTAGIDALINALTAAVTRRIGELVGLRTLSNSGPGVVMAANSVTTASTTYAFSSTATRLSNNHDSLFDTNFYLGNQNDVALLQRVISSLA